MANNRAYLYCDACREAVCFLKTMNDFEWYRANTSEEMLNAFLDEHALCEGRSNGTLVRFEQADGPERVKLPAEATLFQPAPSTGGPKT